MSHPTEINDLVKCWDFLEPAGQPRNARTLIRRHRQPQMEGGHAPYFGWRSVTPADDGLATRVSLAGELHERTETKTAASD